MVNDVRGHAVPAAGDAPRRQSLLDLSLSVNDIVVVASTTARQQLVADLTAKGLAPSAERPLYVHRMDAATIAQLEVTTDGTNWRTILSEAGKGYVADSGGGGGVGATTWTASTDPAILTLPGAGTYLVAASMAFVLSPSAATNIEAHLFDNNGTAFGNAMGASRWVAAGGNQSFTMEFTRMITVPDDTRRRVVIRRRTGTAGGTQTSATEHLHAVRVG